MSTTLHRRALNAVVYSRVSTGAQIEGTSIEDQDNTGLCCARDKAALVVDVVHDEGVSGALYLTRPGIQRALAHIRKGRANCLIVWKLDRLARDLEILIAIRKELKRYGATLIFSDGMEFPDTPEGDLAFNMIGAFPGYQRSQIRAHTMRGRRSNLRAGVQVCRNKHPLGYRIIQKQDVIRGRLDGVLDEVLPEHLGTYCLFSPEASTARGIFEACANGYSTYQIARRLTNEGVPTPGGAKQWSYTTVLYILKNPLYAGRPICGRRERFEDEARVGTYEHGRVIQHAHYMRRREEGDEGVFHLAAPPIISEDLWEACQRQLNRNKTLLAGRGRNQPRYLLATFIRCPSCGQGMVGHRDGYYRCRNNATATSTPCDNRRYYRAADCDNAVIQAVCDLAQRPDSAQEVISSYRRWQAQRQEQPHDTWERIRADEGALKRREQATIDAQIAGVMAGADPKRYQEVFEQIATERSRIANRTTALMEHEQPTVEMDILSDVQQIQEQCRKVRVVMTDERVSLADRRRALIQLVEKVTLTDEGLDVRFLHGALSAKVDLDLSPRPGKKRPTTITNNSSRCVVQYQPSIALQ